jgi:hypothetical protein
MQTNFKANGNAPEKGAITNDTKKHNSKSRCDYPFLSMHNLTLFLRTFQKHFMYKGTVSQDGEGSIMVELERLERCTPSIPGAVAI